MEVCSPVVVVTDPGVVSFPVVVIFPVEDDCCVAGFVVLVFTLSVVFLLQYFSVVVSISEFVVSEALLVDDVAPASVVVLTFCSWPSVVLSLPEVNVTS